MSNEHDVRPKEILALIDPSGREWSSEVYAAVETPVASTAIDETYAEAVAARKAGRVLTGQVADVLAGRGGVLRAEDAEAAVVGEWLLQAT